MEIEQHDKLKALEVLCRYLHLLGDAAGAGATGGQLPPALNIKFVKGGQ